MLKRNVRGFFVLFLFYFNCENSFLSKANNSDAIKVKTQCKTNLTTKLDRCWLAGNRSRREGERPGRKGAAVQSYRKSRSPAHTRAQQWALAMLGKEGPFAVDGLWLSGKEKRHQQH